MSKTTFTAEEDQFIRDNYLTMPIKPLGEKIGRSYTGVMHRLKAMGLTIPPHIIAERKALGRFKQGATPMNKGRKQSEWMPADSIKRSKKTQFKKGNLPHNTRKDGDMHLRADGYIWYRVSKAHWELLHRVIYSQHYGIKLKTTDNIIFKDGNRNNFDINNLQRLSHEELMERNTIQRYPADLQQAIKALSQLTKQIKRYEK